MERTFAAMGGQSDGVIEVSAKTAHRTAFRDPAVRHAMCEDYRAALNEDLTQDRADRAAGRKLDCPILVLWPRPPEMRERPNPAEIWNHWADDVTIAATSGGHLQAEDRADEVVAALVPFLSVPDR